MPLKYRLYRILSPIRVRRQTALRDTRSTVSFNEFQREIGSGELEGVASTYLWERLRDLAFIPDFRPSASDNLGDILALSPEDVRDDLVGGLVDRLGLKTEHIDFTGFSFSSLQSALDIVRFAERVAALQGHPRGTLFV